MSGLLVKQKSVIEQELTMKRAGRPGTSSFWVGLFVYLLLLEPDFCYGFTMGLLSVSGRPLPSSFWRCLQKRGGGFRYQNWIWLRWMWSWRIVFHTSVLLSKLQSGPHCCCCWEWRQSAKMGMDTSSIWTGGNQFTLKTICPILKLSGKVAEEKSTKWMI